MYAIQEDSKIELLQRREIAMRPTSIKHILIQRNLSGILWQFLRGKKCQVLTESEFIFDE